MRTIVALFLCSIASAQGPAEVDRLLKGVADHPDSVPARVSLLASLTNRGVTMPADKVRELRRQHILWLIEHHPEANIYAEPQLLLPTKGRLADPAGAAEAAGLWGQIVGREAKPEVIANAAIYLRAIDLTGALALLDGRANDVALSKARGLVDGAAVVGMTGLGQGVQFGTSPAMRDTREAKAARAEVEASTDANLVGKAGAVLAAAGGQVEMPNEVTFGEEDAVALSERWLRRAIELGLPGNEWKPTLSQTLHTKGNRTLDPKEKARILRESFELAPEGAKPGILQNLVAAEFDSGDDAGAARDANLLLSSAPKNANAYNAAQNILGRIAAAKGDLVEAKSRLIASVTMPVALKNAVFQPEMTLAQDVYEAGDHDAVLQFLEASRPVWKFDRGRIDRMISFVKKAPTVDLVQLSKQFPGSEVLRRAAPQFEATDLDGKMWKSEQLTGKVVALEFGNAPLAEKVAKDRGAVILKVQDDDTRRRFEVLTDPTVVVIDRQGTVSAFRSGSATEPEWRTDLDSGFGAGPNPGHLAAPKQLDISWGASHKMTLGWEAVETAESYVVEWDVRDEKGWLFDREGTVRVIPTREHSATLDLTGFTSFRWRVYAVPKNGPPGAQSTWSVVTGDSFTKNYK